MTALLLLVGLVAINFAYGNGELPVLSSNYHSGIIIRICWPLAAEYSDSYISLRTQTVQQAAQQPVYSIALAIQFLVSACLGSR